MNRRQFLLSAAGFAFTAKVVGACSDDSGGGNGNGGPRADANNFRGFRAYNMDATPDEHSFVIDCADEGKAQITYTATGSGHTHLITLDQDQLEMIFAGQEVTVTTNDSHAHTWVILRPANGCDTPPEPDPATSGTSTATATGW